MTALHARKEFHSDQVRRWPAVLVGVASLGIAGALFYLLFQHGTTRVTTTKTATTTETVTETNALALSLVTGLVALLSATLTATITHWYGLVAERERREVEASTARAARTREQVASVASVVARMLELLEGSHAAAEGALAYERADLWAKARAIVRQSRNDALPHVGVVDDVDLRTRAQTVFATREAWYTHAEEAARRGDPEPPLETPRAAVDSFFERARSVIEASDRY